MTSVAEQKKGAAVEGSETWAHHEVGMARHLGVGREVLRSIRKQLQQGTDWEQVGRNVVYSDRGLRSVCALLGVAVTIETEKNGAGVASAEPVESVGESAGVSESPAAERPLAVEMANQEQASGEGMEAPVVERMRVVRSDFRNRHVVECERPDGRHCMVRVKDAQNFTPKLWNGEPMVLQARLEAGSWFLVGRAPRWRGKW